MEKIVVLVLNPNDNPIELKFAENCILVDIADVYKNHFSNFSDADIVSYYDRKYITSDLLTIVSKYISELERTIILISGIKNESLLVGLKALAQLNVYILALTPDIIELDSNNSFDKDVLNVYMHADYYLNPFVDDAELVKKSWQRFIKIITRVNGAFIPTEREINMYMAYTAMFQSHCLSRAVGSCLTDKDGGLITTGWNDVPKAGGGVYGRNHDNHCFQWTNPRLQNVTPKCHKDLENDFIMEEIKKNLVLQGVELGEKEQYIIDAIKKLQVKGLLEFSRSVHAELHAIIKGSQSAGNRVIDGKLFVTAFPCHNCARHIILSGVKVVYFIEPFVKSRAMKLHSDSLVIANNEEEYKDDLQNRVVIIPFEGVGGKSFEKFAERRGDLKKLEKTIPKFNF